MLANEDAVREKLGDKYWTAKELEDDPDVPRAAFVSEEAIGELEGGITGGFLFLGSAIAMTALLTPAATAAASIAAAVIGGVPGAVIGGLLARRVGVKHKEYFQHQIERGGILLWVRCFTPEKERLAQQIMAGHSVRYVHNASLE
jgi:hypothetical protein